MSDTETRALQDARANFDAMPKWKQDYLRQYFDGNANSHCKGVDVSNGSLVTDKERMVAMFNRAGLRYEDETLQGMAKEPVNIVFFTGRSYTVEIEFDRDGALKSIRGCANG